jgi:hypothetical protein
MSVRVGAVHMPSTDVLVGAIEGAIIIVPAVSGVGTRRTSSSRRIVPLVAGMVAALEADYEAPESGAIERDVLDLVAELVARRMLVAV